MRSKWSELRRKRKSSAFIIAREIVEIVVLSLLSVDM